MPDTLINKVALDSIKGIDSAKTIISSEYTNNSLFGISNQFWEYIISPLIIPVIIGLFGYLLGKRYSSYLEKKRQLNHYREEQAYIAFWIRIIKDDVLKQAEAYVEFADDLKNFRLASLKSLNLHLDKIKLIDSIQLVKLFISNKIGSQESLISLLYRFEKSLDFIIRRSESDIDKLEIIGAVTDEISVKWNQNFIELQNKMQEVSKSYKNLHEPNFGLEILELFNGYKLKGIDGMDFFMNFFAEKVGMLCSNYFNKYPNDKLIQEILNLLGMLKHAFESKQRHFEKFSNEYKESSQLLISNYEILVEIVNKWERIEFKPIKWIV